MKKKMTKSMKKPVFLVMGSTLAFLSFCTPLMAQDVKSVAQITDSVKGADTNFKSSDYIKERDNKSGNDSEHKDKEGTEVKANADVESKTAGDQSKKDVSAKVKAFVTDITNVSQAGKEKISFTVPDDEKDIDMEFTTYQIKGNERVVFSKTKGKYNAGKHTIDVDLPQGSDKYDLEVSCKRAGDNKTVLWSRASLDKSWKNLEINAVNTSDQTVKTTGSAAITDVSSVAVSGKTKITFNVQKAQQGPVELDFICYKKTGDGRVVQSKIHGKYDAGQHTVEVDLPQNMEKYDLEIAARANENYSAVLWNRAAEGEWKASNGNTLDLAAILLQKIKVAAIPTTDVNVKIRSWKVENPSTEAVTINWKIDGSDQSGTQTIAAGQAATISANQGNDQQLLVSVAGERGYNVSIMPTVSAAEFNTPSNGGGSTPSTANSGSTPSSSGGSSSSDNSSPGGSSTSGDSSFSSSSPATGSTSSSMPVMDTAPGTMLVTDSAMASTPTDLTGTASLVADASMGPNDMSQPSAVSLSQLPQTGEKSPVGFYSAGALLALFGSLFLRKRKNQA
jgi:LPXTG-motif cell wall-anchored protein